MVEFHKKTIWPKIARLLCGCIFVVVYLFGAHVNRMQKWNEFSAWVVQIVQEPSSAGNELSFYILISGEGDSFSRWVFAVNLFRNNYFLRAELNKYGDLYREQRFVHVYIARQTDTLEFHRAFMVTSTPLPAMQRYFSAPANFICADVVDFDDWRFQGTGMESDPDLKLNTCERFYAMAHAKANQEWGPWQWPYFFDARPILPAWLIPYDAQVNQSPFL